MYRQLVHEITETFNKISADILAIKEKFAAENSLIPIAEIIHKVQTAEKAKLEMVVIFNSKKEILNKKGQCTILRQYDCMFASIKHP